MPVSTLVGPLDLLSRIIRASSQYPSFERDFIHPIMGKASVTMSRLLERCLLEEPRDFSTMVRPPPLRFHPYRLAEMRLVGLVRC